MGGGYMCAAPNCKNTYRNSTLSFFRFPKDPERAKEWVLACGRTEFLKELNSLHYSSRICGAHFDSSMFLNSIGNRLQSDAIPSIFPDTEVSQTAPASEVGQRIRRRKQSFHTLRSSTINDVNPNCQPQPTQKAPQPQSTTAPTCSRIIPIVLNKNVFQQHPTTSANNAEGSQTNITPQRPSTDVRFSLSSKRELRKIVKKLENENANLRKRIQGNFTQPNDLTSDKTKIDKYSAEFNEYSLSLYFLGPKLYKEVFANKLCLPTTDLLKNFVSQTSFSPGVTQSTTDFLETKFRNLQQTQKFCTLCIDEIKLTPGLFYGTSSDAIIGFKDSGNDVREFKPALKALIVVAKGFYVNWQQPITYCFLNSPSSEDKLKDFILEAIAQLSQIDIRVIAVISSMTPSTKRIARLLKITPDSPCFLFEDKKIVFLYNTEELLSITRNDIMQKSFGVGDKTTNWTHLLKFFNHDKKYSMKVAPNLSLSHLCPNKKESRRTKIKYAYEIFNHNIVTGMNLYIRFKALPQDTEATLEFIKRISDLRNVLSVPSNKQTVKKGSNLKDGQYFQDSYDFFNNLKTLSKEGRNIDGMPVAKSVLGWKTTTKGIQILYETLANENLPFPSTLAINHNCLKRFRRSFKNSNNKCSNPRPIKFYKAFKRFFCRNLIMSGIGNFKEDYDEMSLKLAEIPPNRQSTEIKALVNLDLDYQRSNELKMDFSNNICHYLIKKCSARHSCQICEDYVKDYENSYEVTLPYYKDVYKDANSSSVEALDANKDSFIYFVASMEILFRQNFQRLSYNNNVIHELTTLLSQLNYQHPCQDFPYYYIFEMYARVRLFYAIKNINRNFRLPSNINKLIICEDNE